MSQLKRKKNAISGWLVLDKPQNMTSAQAVGMVKRLFSPEKVGHAGTLDPLATGVLPIALGEATKTVAYAMEGTKAYTFTVQWGAETDTDDMKGKITKTSAHRPEIKEIERILPRFRGRIQQIPPQFSAIKIAGERAYDIARDGKIADVKPREVFINRFEIENTEKIDRTIFTCECGKGAYVRSLARDMGRLLGCYGHITQLRRTRVGPFELDDAVTADELKAGQETQNGLQPFCLFPVATVLDDIPAVGVTQKDADRLRHGQAVLIRGRDAPLFEGPAYASYAGALLALGDISQGSFVPTRVFNLNGTAAAVPSRQKETVDVDHAGAQARAR